MNQENVASAYLHDQAKKHLLAFVERIERLEEEKKALAADISEVLKEAKGNGFCTKTIRKVIALRKKEEHERLEDEMLLTTYLAALDMIPQLSDTPLGQASLGSVPPKIAGKLQEAGKEEADAIHARRLEDARQRGWDAGREGKKDTDNPFTSEDACFSAWEEARGSIVPARVAA